jgi:hypothetical protein
MKKSISIIFLTLLIFNSIVGYSQDKPKAGLKVGAEIVSNYVWRGSPSYTTDPNSGATFLSPNIQPVIAFTYGSLELGSWASMDYSGAYKETDLYLSWAKGPFTFTLNDYYWDLAWMDKPFFDYKNETTGHILEASLNWKCKKYPIGLSVNTMLYGADKKWDSDSLAQDPEKNNYSTYIELTYGLKINEEQKLDLFMGMTPADGYYGDSYGGVESFGVVNLGATASKTLKFNDKTELPVRTSLIFNPMHEKAYLVIGISF